MATATQKNETTPGTVSTMLANATKEAEAIIKDIGAGVVSITARVKDLAVVVVATRGNIERSVTSKKTGKAVTVKDWDGRSPEYREWFKDTLIPLIEEHIPQEFRGTVRSRLQNQVQEQVHKTAPAAQKAHLGMSSQSKATTQEAKRAAAKTAPAPARESQEVMPSDGIVASINQSSLVDACEMFAAAAAALATRTGKDGWSQGMSKGERKRCADLLRQALAHGMTARGTLAASVEERETTRTRTAA